MKHHRVIGEAARGCAAVYFISNLGLSNAFLSLDILSHLPVQSSTPCELDKMNFTTGASVAELLSLETIRSQLIRLEDTIIFCESRAAKGLGMGSTRTSDLTEHSALIERAQFAYNGKIYEPGAFKGETGFDGSWLEWFLYEIETFHGEAQPSPS